MFSKLKKNVYTVTECRQKTKKYRDVLYTRNTELGKKNNKKKTRI